MAENENTVFFLDEDDEEFGGFDEAPKPSDAEDKKEKEGDSVQEQGGAEKKEADAQDVKADDDREEDDQKSDDDPAAQKQEEDAVKKNEPNWNEVIAKMAKQSEQINVLVAQNQELQKKIVNPDPEPVKADPPVKPELSRDDWEDDPVGCTAAMYKYNRDLEEYQSFLQEEQQTREASEKEKNLKAVHQKDWEDEVSETPILANPQVSQIWADIFYNGGYSKMSDGVIRATRELKRQAKQRGIDLSRPIQDQAKAEPTGDKKQTQDPEESARRGAEDEAARQKRVKVGAMHSGGKGGGQSKITLTAEDKLACERIGCSPENYLKTLEAMGGRK